MAAAVVVSGSHGGRSAASFALGTRPAPRAVFFNDAGVGKERAGIVALHGLEQAGIVAVTYSHNSARIGDAVDGFGRGVVSAANAAAAAAGLDAGQTLAEAVALIRRERAGGGDRNDR